MFEDSLFESQHRIVSPRGRLSAAASIAMQAALASLLIVVPLLRTEMLPSLGHATRIAVPLPTPPAPPIPKTVVQRASTAPASAALIPSQALTASRRTPDRIDLSTEPGPPAVTYSTLSMEAGPLPGAIVSPNGAGHSSVRVTPQRAAGPIRVSGGVSAGLLLTPIRPVYPPIAKAAHVEGTVLVEAIISKTGTIESLHAVSGPVMLQAAAIEAIRAARYQPFKLNDQPVEVQTTITVNFRFGG